MAVLLQVIIDNHASAHKLYGIVNPVINLMDSSLFFGLGPIFVVGILIAQYHPRKRWMIILNFFVLLGLFTVQELLLLSSKMLVYYNWHYTDSILLSSMVIAFLSWFSMIVLNKKGRSLK